MGLIDLNSCTARQLTEYARIGKSLADSIIRYRRCYGGYKHFDELWKITGISRASYRNLQQYFYVGGQTVPAMGERLPNAKLAITESMLQMLTHEHIAEQRAMRKASGTIVAKKAGESSTSPGGFIRTVRSAKQGKSQEWQLSTSDNVERAKSTPLAATAATDEASQSKVTNQCEIRVPVGDAILEIDGKAFKNVPNPGCETKGDQLLLSSRGKYFKKAWEGSKGPQEANTDPTNAGGPTAVDEGAGPSVVLRASSSGNNINVSCTFDKNLLNSEKPVALKFNSDKKVDNIEDIIEEAGEQSKEEQVHNKQKSAAKKKVTATQSSKLAVQASKQSNDKSDPDKAKPKSGKKREHQPLKKDEECQTFLSELNRDNLDYFTAEKKFGATKQRKVIEAWVEDVNEHIKAGTLEYTGENVLSEADKSRVQSASGPIRKVQPITERAQPITWQLKTKTLTLPDRSAEEQKNIAQGSFGMTGLWTRLRDMASTPFRGLYNNRLEEFPPPSVPPQTKQKKLSSPKAGQAYVVDNQAVAVKRRHSDKKIPPLHDSHQPNYRTSSSSSSRQPRKSAKGSIYAHENLSHNCCSRDKMHNSQMSPSSRRWAEDTIPRAFKYSAPSPGLSEKHASKSWRDLQIQLLQKRLRQMKSNNYHQSPRKKTSQKYVISPDKPHRSNKFV